MRIGSTSHRSGRSRLRAALAAAAVVSVSAIAGAASAGTSEPSDAHFAFAYHVPPSTLHPFRYQNDTQAAPLALAYDRLLDVSPSGELVPMLATEWSWDEAGTTLSFVLREGVTFHDGTAFDAAAVVANIEHLLALADAPARAMIANVESAAAVGELEVAISLSQPDSTIPYAFASRAGAQVSPAALAAGVDLAAEAVGAGPYRVVGFTAGERIEYERFADYWDPTANAYATVEFVGIADDFARLNALRSDEVQAAYLTPSQADEALGLGLQVVEQPSAWHIQMNLNRTHGDLGDLAVRQAIDHAIDREAICAAIYFGHCLVQQLPIPPGHPAVDPDADTMPYPYDPDRARELLADAGYEAGDVTLTLTYLGAADPYPQLAQAIQAQLADVGIVVELRPAEPGQLTDIHLVRQETDAMLGGSGAWDPVSWFRTAYRTNSFWNAGNHAVEGSNLDELIDIAGATTDEAAYSQAVYDVLDEIVAQALNLPLIYPNVILGSNDTVTGLQVNRTFNTPYLRGIAPSE